MSLKVSELLRWLSSLEKDDVVWIDDGGLNLESKDGAYIEVGERPPAPGKIEFYDEDENPEGFWK